MSNRQQQFTNSLPFKIMGEFYWPYEGQPRKATESEKLLWAKCMSFIAEIEVIQPVSDCPHKYIRKHKTQAGYNAYCLQCDEFVMQEGTHKRP